MGKYKLVITDLETGEIMHQHESTTIVYHVFMTDKDGDPSTGSGIVHSGMKMNLLGVLASSMHHSRREIDKLIEED